MDGSLSMQSKQGVAILMMIATLLGMVRPDETTKKIDKLRTQIRKRFNELIKRKPTFAHECMMESNRVWEHAKKEVNDLHFTIGLEPALLALYAFIEDDKIGGAWFTKRTFYEAMRSMEMVVDARDNDAEVEKASNNLVDIFADALGIKQSNKLKLMKQRIYNNLVLEGKIK